MQEVALVRAIVDLVGKKATAQKARRVKWLRIRFNALTSYSAEQVRFSFDIVKRYVPLIQDAELKLSEVEPLLLCQCGHRFTGRQLKETCPRCGSEQVQAVNSTDMVLEGFEIER
jgi:hydrogenase nickel incorporation protein HypA/HybF